MTPVSSPSETGIPGSKTTALTGFFLHGAAVLHDPGWGHPEHQGRLRALASAIASDLPALHERVAYAQPGAATEDDLALVHASSLVEAVRDAVGEAGRRGKSVAVAGDTDTRVSTASWDAVLGTVGAGLDAVSTVAKGVYRNAFVAGRPPGHHATPDRAMGFCLFNSVAIAAATLRARNQARRVLIVDWDVHHGNGTQDIFYDDPAVFFLSLHQYPHYPGTGAADETGTGAGEGFTLNVPLPAGTSRENYLKVFGKALDAAVSRSDPDFVLVSAGFDVLAGDPLGGQLLEPEDLHWMTLRVIEAADRWCEGRVVVFLEGGYDPGRTGAGCVAVVRALAGVPAEGSAAVG